MITIEKEEEIIALNKVLNFVKFKSEDYESRYLAASPIVSDLLKRFSELSFELWQKRPPYKPNFVPSKNIEDYQEPLEAVKRHIKHTDNWLDLTREQKEGHLKVLISPYDSQEATINDLIQAGDKLHVSMR